MVTKKKPSAAQIAARKLFAERAKAGAFAKSPAKRKATASKKHFASGSGVEAAEAHLRIAKKVAARKKNPSKPLKDHNAKYPSGYSGKYPGRVKTVYSAGRGVVMVELNDGSRHKVTAEMTDGEMPRVGDTFPTYANNPVKKASFPRAKRGNSFMNYAQCYRVEKAYVDNDWSTVGYFVTKDEAFQYARAYNKANDCKVRVLSPEI